MNRDDKNWVEKVAADLGIEVNIPYIEAVLPLCEKIFLDGDKGYSLILCTKNITNKKIGMVVSFYLRPEHRNYRNFKELLKRTEDIARAKDCVHLSFGCEVDYQDERVYKMLARNGYTQIASVKKEL